MKFMTQYFRLLLAAMLLPMISFAEGAGEAAGHGPTHIGLGVGIAMGLAVLGAGLGQGKIASAFMEGASRNPSSVAVTRTMLILSLIFVETLVLFAVLICCDDGRQAKLPSLSIVLAILKTPCAADLGIVRAAGFYLRWLSSRKRLINRYHFV